MSISKKLTFQEAQELTDKLVQQLGGYWPPLGMLAAITEEVGELAREINALENIKKKKPTEAKKDLGEELADVIYGVVCVANHYNIDLGESYQKILQKFQVRDKTRF
jgi:NTP pyrophosphatase (non-canonical NTP hydrolase)